MSMSKHGCGLDTWNNEMDMRQFGQSSGLDK